MSRFSAENLSEDTMQVTLEDALELARDHHDSGNIVIAERTYRDILKAYPKHFPSNMFLGILLFQSGNVEEALKYLQEAVEVSSDNKGAWNNYGGVLAGIGRFEDAIGAFDKALAIDPDFTDALSNKSYALWKCGKNSEAEAVARHALEINPEDVGSLNNLGVSLARLLRYEEAFDTWEKAVELAPEDGSIWNNWGYALREAGKLQQSEEKGLKAIEFSPKDADALNNLANVVRDLGRAEEAVEIYKRAIAATPTYPYAHGNLAIAHMDLAQYAEASVSAQLAIAFDPNYYDAYITLANSLKECGEYNKAHNVANNAIRMRPDDAAPYVILSDIALRSGQFAEAEAAMQQAVKFVPDSARVYESMAKVYDQQGNTAKAREAIDKAIELSPDMVVLWVLKSHILYASMQLDKALETINYAIEKSPVNAAYMMQKAEILISLNRSDEALKLINRILEKTKTLHSPYVLLVSLGEIKSEDDPRFQEMLVLEKEIYKYGYKTRSVYLYALSDAYEKFGNYDKAFEYMKRASDTVHDLMPVLGDTETEMHDSFKYTYSKELVNAACEHGCKSEKPIFIVGMPRSGTTLTEQILSSHPDIYGAGELEDLRLVYHMVSGQGQIEFSEVEKYGEEYIKLIEARVRDGKDYKRITNKMPANYVYMGLMFSLLPNAKVIHCRRHPMDTLLSCYRQAFSKGQRWSYNQEEAAYQYLRYLDIMQHWRENFPERFIDVDYEETVNNFEEQARMLVDYVGMDWDDACLEPHKQKRAVITASKAQVTQPIYKTSVQKWRRYEEHLQPMLKVLQDANVLDKDGNVIAW